MPPTAPGDLYGSETPPAPAAPADLLAAASATRGMQVTGTVAPDGDGWLAPAGTLGGRAAYSLNGEAVTGLPPVDADDTQAYWDTGLPGWVIAVYSGSELLGAWTSASDVATPDLATGWAGFGGATGTPVVSPSPKPAADLHGSPEAPVPAAPGGII